MDNEYSLPEDNEEKRRGEISCPEECNNLNNENLHYKANENISLPNDSKSVFTTPISDDLPIQTKDYNESSESPDKELCDQTSKKDQVNKNMPLTNSSVTCPQEEASNSHNVPLRVMAKEKPRHSGQMSGDVKIKSQSKTGKNLESEGKVKSEYSEIRTGGGDEQPNVKYLKQSEQESKVDTISSAKGSKGPKNVPAKPGTTDKSKICLRFHIIIPSDEVNKCGEISLDGQSFFKQFVEVIIVNHKKNLFEDVDILHCEVDLPKGQVSGKTISYVYSMAKAKTSIKFHMNLDFLKNFQDLYEWNIYDAYLPGEPNKSLLGRFKSAVTKWFVGNRDDDRNILLAWYFELFPKNFSDSPGGGQNFVFEFLSVFKSAERSSESFKIADDCLKKMVAEFLREFLSNKSDKDCLSRASCVLYLFMECKLSDDEISHQLCSLLSIRPDGNKKCVSYEYFCKLFPGQWRRKIADALLKFLERIVNLKSIDPDWILALPFLHFLEGKSKPFKELNKDVNHENEEWWGVSSISGLKDVFKRKMSQNMPLDFYMQSLPSMFEVDHLLPRSFLALMNLHHIPQLICSKKFPLDACLANVTFFIKTEKNSHCNQDHIFDCLNGIKSLMDDVLQDPEKFNDAQGVRYILELTFSLFFRAMDSFLSDDIKLLSVSIMISALRVARNLVEKLPIKNDTYNEELNRLVDKVTLSTKRWLQILPFGYQIFSQLLELSTNSTTFDKHWETLIKDIFMNKFGKMKFFDKCSIFSKIMTESCHPCLKVWIFDVMLKEVENGLKRQTGELHVMFEHDNMHTFKGIFDVIVDKIWPPKDDALSILMFALNHPLFVKLVNVYRMKNLGEESGLKLAQAMSILEDVQKSLFTGGIKIILVNELSNHSDEFLRLLNCTCDIENEEQKNREDEINELLKQSKRDFQFYGQRCERIRVLLDFCHGFDTSGELNAFRQEILLKSSDLSLSDISNLTSAVDNQPMLKILQIVPEAVEMLEFLCRYQESMILKDLWDSCLEKSSLKSASSLTDIVEFIYIPCKELWEKMSKALKDRSIRLSDVQKKFLQFSDHDLLKELSMLCKDKDETKNLHDQIKNYRKLCECKKGAETMLEFKSKFELSGSFDDAEKIADVVKRESLSLGDVSKELIEECKALQDFSDIQRKCLEVFIEEKQFVEWLRKSLSGPREIKVLVDLALISAEGQGDMEVEKASCLHAAATAYSSLIYDLKTEMGFTEFISLCKTVWSVAGVDARIAEKFRDAARHLEWFIGIKKSHGAVEVNALESASIINSKGIFIVGNLRTKDTNALMLEDVVQMKLYLKKGERCTAEHSEDSETWKVCGIKYLSDLQSKLMLVAGKAQEGKKDVEVFNRTLDGVMRLANVYVKLVDRGCCMFTSWKVTFFCNPTKQFFARIDFSSNDQQSEHILGTHKDSKKLKIYERIEKLCGIMEGCLKEWNEYIQEKRLQKHYINFFTTKQLIILQKEIAKALNDENADIGRELSLLLSLVNPSSTKEDLLLATKNALQQLSKSADDELGDISVNKPSEDDKDDSVSEFVKALLKVGFPLLLAKAAEEHFDSENLQEAILWCMENENNLEQDEMEENILEQKHETFQTEKINFYGFLQEEMTNLSKKLPSENSLEGNFLEIWKTFLEKVDSGFADYISIELLGLILEKLGSECGARFDSARVLPCQMKEGRPNLVLSDESQVWNTILSIYANSLELPLPCTDEVLICDRNTSAEEIEIMCMRAKAGKSGKLYCLARAELLDYNVAVSVEKSLSLIKEDAKFVIICDCNVHSHIADALDQFKVKFTPLDVMDIQKYVQVQLMQQDSFFNPEISCARLIRSDKAGTGKTLKARRTMEEFALKSGKNASFLSIPLQNKRVDASAIVKRLRKFAFENEDAFERIIHFDVSSEVVEGVDCFLFNLLILGTLNDQDGYVWRKLPGDVYLVESCPIVRKTAVRSDRPAKGSHGYLHKMFYLLPAFNCRSPNDSLRMMKNEDEQSGSFQSLGSQSLDQKLDEKEFKSEHFQRVCRYLSYQLNQPKPDLSMRGCTELLLRFCGVEDPSWAELKHFIDFFNNQLVAYENSVFCQIFMVGDLPDFGKFVIDFMLLMSQDFATRSLKISEESPEMLNDINESLTTLMQICADYENKNVGYQNDYLNLVRRSETVLLEGYKMKRTWEISSHPYLFFNNDGHSFTFIGFVVDRATGNIVDPANNNVLGRAVVRQPLFDALQRNGVNLSENFDMLTRVEKLIKMATIMGLEDIHDPDETYELTADNVKKMLAIYMRFRCNIPVVVMGETGCGKTRLIKFLCDFMKPPFSEIKNMCLMKIHGGTTMQNIVDKIKRVSALARENSEEIPGIKTVLFFDEANTTSAVGLIKEAMCDRTICGESLEGADLKLIAACNPYRRHSNELINKLEKAGLGYHVSSTKTTDRLGTIPMRHLVYRVRCLPPSMFPLVWDFGRLDEDAEKLYIRQMVHCCISKDLNITSSETLILRISEILSASQSFMRLQKDECSFVSLRDVERCLKVMVWFYQHDIIFAKMDEIFAEKSNDSRVVADGNEQFGDDGDEDEDDVEEQDDAGGENNELDDLSRSLILALGVCYHACLSKREDYRSFISPYFDSICPLKNGPATILEEISVCQDVFLKEVDLDENIARNQALKENLFVMVVCIELRIPLFLIGKPGSSKSLAKTVVADAMQGNQSKSKLFRSFKSAHMVSYQCSPLSTPEGITGMFKQCAKLQEGKDLNKFVSVVVLDEVGLAEDSEKMPLKALHPLLEDGCEDEDEILPHKKVAFIGISNWSLDPAKMNRGIFVQRCSPDENELILSARGICSSDETILRHCGKLFGPLARGYLKLCETTMEIKEFFGLRDFYSLIKMIYAVSKCKRRTPSWTDLQRAILRNFSGLERVKALELFKEYVKEVVHIPENASLDRNYIPASLIRESLAETDLDFENRYLLILMDNYSSFNLLQHDLLQMNDARIIFGSSFPNDLEYTQICRNINRIKIYMETGKTVVLLNLENLYESLYDALNQYYVTFGGQRFVDLGLGTQRVKCKVHKSFKLIVVADKQVVYKRFPIPLINRLEKHYLSIDSLLTPEQVDITRDLQKWAEEFTRERIDNFSRRKASTLADVFIGFHPNALASLVLQAFSKFQKDGNLSKNEILEHCQDLLLQCAVPESVLGKETDGKDIYKTYFEKQQHNSLENFIKTHVVEKNCPDNVFAQITTHSRLLSKVEVNEMAKRLGLLSESVELLSLQAFGTEQQFSGAIKSFFESLVHCTKILIIQCDSGDQYEDLIACTRFNIMNDYSNWDVQIDIKHLKHVLLIIQLPKVIGGCFVGFQGGKWLSYHIDNLHPDSTFTSLLPQMKDKSVSSLFSINGFQQSENQKEFEQEEAKNRILENCIHAAAALLKSPVSYDAFRSRKAKSLEALIQNLHAKDRDDVTFLDVLRMRVSQLLLEREESVTTEPESWLKREAASLENVCNAGSFGNSVLQYLEAKVTPILAYIISYIDSNCNLDLLSTSDEWIINLWFGMFRDANITFMKYNEIKAVKGTKEVLEFDMRTYRKDGLLMKGRFPFSWLIKENIDKLMSQQHPRSEWLSKTFDVEETFNSSDIGKLLQTFSQDVEHKQMIFDMYLSDYIQMTYKPASSDSDKEFEMVANDVKHNILLPLMMINNSSTNPTNLMSFSGIHEMYIEHCIKYKLFSQIVSCCPKIVDDMSDHEKGPLKGMTLLQKCLIYILEMLTFSKEEHSQSIKQWANKVKGLTSLVNQLFCQIQSEDLKIDLQSLMCTWSRISTLKLFVEHTSSKQLLDQDIYYKIWTYMGERFDFKTWKCFENIDKFLKMCQKKGIEKCFGSILPSKCCSCGKENGIIKLLCDHRFCSECFDEIKAFHRNKCPRCHRTAECADDSKGVKTESIEKYLVFKKQLNSFFMTLVSKMCFDGGKPPEEKIVEKLLNDVVFESELDRHLRTRNLICGRDDPSPVIRSFLLQLLLKHRMSLVQKHLERFLKDQLVLCQDEPQIMELGILCLNCFEDHYKNCGTKNSGMTERLNFVMNLWKKNSLISLTDANQAMDVKTLQNVALLRFGLSELADGLHEHYIKDDLDDRGYCAMRSLGHLASAIFTKIDRARCFLMKQIAHKFSFQNLLLFAEDPTCRWFISPQDIKTEKQDSSLDHFLLCGQNYKTTRDCLFQAFYEKNPTLVDKAGDFTEYNLMLALFQQMMHSSTSEMVDVDVDIWNDYLSGKTMLKNKDLAMKILKHELRIVNANSNSTYAEKNLQVLVFHFMVATKLMLSKSNIIQLLCLPMNKPEILKDTYLPTMPQDDRFEVLELLQKREAIKFYACPNNHPYTIGECGMPNSRSRCLTCGEEIGGMNHTLVRGNKSLALTVENTQPGHILGQPGKAKTPSGERQMTPLQVSMTRLFLHASLYIGSFGSVFPNDFIKPVVPQVATDFFMNHMKHDLEMIQRASGHNEDNVLIVLHTIIHAIYEKTPPNKSLNLSTKDGRLQWENEFVKEYIRPHLDEMNEIIDKGRKVMLKDDGLVLSPLMKEIYEIKDTNLPATLGGLHQCPIFWKYRPRISKEHLLINLHNLSEINGKYEDGGQEHYLLQYFLENGQVLQEIRKLSAILDLHNRLCVALNRRISIYEADNCTVSEFLNDQDEMTKASLEELFEEFFSAWNVLRFNLKEFPFQQKVVPEEYLKEHLGFYSKIGFFLPTMQGLGVCSVALIYYLADQQNQLLTIYDKTIGKGMTRVVSLRECTSAHLIQFDPEKELHTLILAHCNYSLEPGKSTKLEYDYANLEIQIMDHFIHDKPMIRPNIKLMNYKEDFNVCVVFSEIENKIPQVPTLSELLENDFKILPDVAKVLPCFNVVLEFIASIGNNQDENIVEFMTKTLKMRNVFADYPSMSSLQFKHAKQAWISLSFIQAKMQVKNGQLPFWSVDGKYKKIMSDEMLQKLMNCLQYTRKELFSLLLYECIILNITVSNGDDDLDNSNQSLRDILLEFINSKGQESSLGILESGTFPKKILACHCIDAWLCSVDPEKRVLLK